MLFMFIALFAATSWIQVVNADALQQHPDNRRTLFDSYEIQRGAIIVDDVPIVTSIPSDDVFSFQRVYDDGAMWAPVTGYFNPALQSWTGIERALNAELSGTGATAFFASVERILSGQPQRGANAALTLNAAGQEAAYEALRGLQGAVLAIEPATGRVLVMASTPSFDTNLLATHNSRDANDAYEALRDDPSHPMYNRAIGGDTNPPGSTFKVVVAAAALDSGEYTPESTFPNPATYTLPGTSTEISNAWNGACGSGETATIADALRLSCNTIFAQLAVELGDDVIREMAEKFGFNRGFELPLESTPSLYPDELSPDRTALSGYGLGDVTATPLQMAMMSAGVANGGVVMNPRMIDGVLGNDLSVQRSYDDSEFGQALSPETAQTLMEMMVDGVENGAAGNARIEGVAVAGKTGTAERGEQDPKILWFTGFAPADNPQIAVAVVVEDGGGQGRSGSGNSIAAPIAKQVIEAVLNR